MNASIFLPYQNHIAHPRHENCRLDSFADSGAVPKLENHHAFRGDGGVVMQDVPKERGEL